MIREMTSVGWGRWLVPSLTQWLWLMLLLVLLSPWWRTAMVGSDGDTGMHWRMGEEMLRTGHVLRQDIFSHTRADEPFVALAWLSEVVFAVAGRWAGWHGIGVLAALVIATTWAWLHRQLRREGHDLVVATAVVLLGAWAASMHWLARPLLFTVLLALLWNAALRRFERDPQLVRLWASLAGLMVVWVNLHAGFTFGFTILAAYWLGAALELARIREPADRVAGWRKLGVLTGAGLLVAAVSLLNPYGWEVHRSILTFVRSEYLRNWFAEYQSPNFHQASTWGLLAWLAMLVGTLVVARPRLRAAEAVLVLGGTYAALYAVRNIPLLVVVTAPVVSGALSVWSRPFWAGRFGGGKQFAALARGWPVVAVLAVAAISRSPRLTELPAQWWPVAAVAHVRAHPEEFRGPVFNQFVWGGYLMRVLPEHKVFVDGRADFYGADLLREFSDTTALKTNWTAALEKYDVQWSLMPTDHPLNQALAASGWERAYTDPVATIYRRSP